MDSKVGLLLFDPSQILNAFSKEINDKNVNKIFFITPIINNMKNN
jgi:hypothetical protein